MHTTRQIVIIALVMVLGTAACRSGQVSEEDDPPQPEPPPDTQQAPDTSEPAEVSETLDVHVSVDTSPHEETTPEPEEAYVRVPAGTGWIGDDTCGRDCPSRLLGIPEHEIEITYDYEIKRAKVSVVEWNSLMPEALATGDPRGAAIVSWHDALEYCDRLSISEGLEPCYRIAEQCAAYPHQFWERDCTQLAGTVGDVLECEGYRLPTEAEWDFAMRAGRRNPELRDLDATALTIAPYPPGEQPPEEWNWPRYVMFDTYYLDMPPDWDINSFGIRGMFTVPHEWLWDRRRVVYTPEDNTINPVYPHPTSQIPKSHATRISLHTIPRSQDRWLWSSWAFRPVRRITGLEEQ